jgi:hypothetical protein
MRRALVLGAVLAVGLAGCASSPEAPEWADASGFPSLREVPTGGTSATTDARHWNAIEADLLAARQTVQSNPRSQNTEPTENPEQFLDEARREVEETRNSHDPY